MSTAVPNDGFTDKALAELFEGKCLVEVPKITLLPVTEQNDSSRNREENNRRVVDWMKKFGQPELFNLARLLGGGYCTGSVAASSSATGDTRFEHTLGRIPSMIVQSVDLDGIGGQILGAPQGGQGASGSNETPWTKTEFYVRGSLGGRYAFIIL